MTGPPWREALENLEALERRRTQLREDLSRSLRILEVFPDAFRAGRVRSWVHGGPSRGFRFVLERRDGSREIRPLEEVPSDFWPWPVVVDAWAGRLGKAWRERARDPEAGALSP